MRSMRTLRLAAAWCVLLAPAGLLQAAEPREIVELRDSVADLLSTLVKRGVLSPDHAEAVVVKAHQDTVRELGQAAVDGPEAAAQAQAAQEREARERVEAELRRAREQKQLRAAVEQEVSQVLAARKREESDQVRVRYVPDFIIAQIREQVKTELKEEVAREIVDGVYERDGEEGLPIPEVPAWVDRLSLKGSLRLRYQNDFMAGGNGDWLDYQEINSRGLDLDSDGGSVDPNELLLNPDNADRDRFLARLHLDLDAKLGSNMKAGVRLTTGSTDNPVSTNQTLGNGSNKYSVVLDRLFLSKKWLSEREDTTVSVTGGRFANPFFSTPLVFDSDLGFEGATAKIERSNIRPTIWAGVPIREQNYTATVGAFPLEEFASGSSDKWLFAGQVESDILLRNWTRFRLGLGYYHYENVTGVRDSRTDPTDTRRLTSVDDSLPAFMQKGNTLFDLYPQGTRPSDIADVFGLASDFRILNLTGQVELRYLDPVRLWFTADYAKNLGYDRGDIEARLAGGLPTNPLSGSNDTAYSLELRAGWPDFTEPGNWQAFGGYRYIEPDAVLDAYTDSDFHLGGTNSKGWQLGFTYALGRNLVANVRYMSARQITVPNSPVGAEPSGGQPVAVNPGPLSLDTIQAEIVGRF